MTTHEIVVATAPLSVPSLRGRLAIARRALAEADQLPEISNLIAQADVVRLAARKAEPSREAQNDWGEYSLDAQRKAGVILRQMASAGERAAAGERGAVAWPSGNSDTPSLFPKPTLVQLGVADKSDKARQRASRWQQIASIPEPVYEDWKAEIRAEPEGVLTQAGALRLASGAHVRHNSGVSEWYTPPEVLATARAAMGRIDERVDRRLHIMSVGRVVAIVLAVLGVLVGAVQAARPETLGLPVVVSAWLGVLGAVIAGWQAFLPPVHKPGA